jgi:hypothetical protein
MRRVIATPATSKEGRLAKSFAARAAVCLLLSGLVATTAAAVSAVPATAAAAAGKLFAGVHGSGTATCKSAADACTLAKALGQAAAGDTIELTTPGHVGTSSSYYSPGSSGFSISTSGTSATSPVTIEPAPGVTGPILDGGGSHRILSVGKAMHLVISSLTFRDGFSGATTSAGGISDNTRGFLTVSNSTFSDNEGPQDGGAIENGAGGTLTVSHSTFSGNTACLGGAIGTGYKGSGTTTVTGSTFSGNSAICQGGAIANANGGSGRLTVTASTFSGNSAPDGGAIENGDGGTGTTTVIGSTFSGNPATSDGTTIDNGDAGGKGSTVVVGGDIIAGFCNQISGNWSDEGDNVALNATCFKGGQDDVTSAKVAALLGPLADNGGSTLTMMPLPGNPAIGLIANPTGFLCPLAADQTGKPSPAGSPCNAGSLQAHPAIHSVSFSGAEDAQVVTVTGTGFGTAANLGPAATPCSAPLTGKDYAGTFYFKNTTRQWGAGDDAPPSCDYVGLVIDSYTSTTIVFGFGSNFSTYANFSKGNAWTLHLLGTSYSGKWS